MRTIVKVTVILDGKNGSVIQPLVDLGVSVSEAESAGSVVIAGGHIPIELRQLRLVRETGHINPEIACADRVVSLVPEQ